MNSPILQPVVALVAWSMFILGWMAVTRLPAIAKAKLRLDRNAPRGEQMNQLPAPIRWKADNYNNLMEQPTLFYAVALVLSQMGLGGGINNQLAWCYVILRIGHSLVHTIGNHIPTRFMFFLLSTIVLGALVFNAARAAISM